MDRIAYLPAGAAIAWFQAVGSAFSGQSRRRLAVRQHLQSLSLNKIETKASLRCHPVDKTELLGWCPCWLKLENSCFPCWRHQYWCICQYSFALQACIWQRIATSRCSLRKLWKRKFRHNWNVFVFVIVQMMLWIVEEETYPCARRCTLLRLSTVFFWQYCVRTISFRTLCCMPFAKRFHQKRIRLL